VASSSPNCVEFQKQFNHCYKGAYIDGEYISEKRKNATEYENRSKGCANFVCDNRTGAAIQKMTCNDPPKCYQKEGICDETTGDCVYEKKSEWNELFPKENKCYEVKCKGDDWALEKRNGVLEWEGRTDKCVEYLCDNETGFIFRGICSSTNEARHFCVESLCIDSDEEQKAQANAVVEIEMTADSVQIGDMNLTLLMETLSELCNVPSNKMRIGYESNNRGFVFRMYFYVDEESAADRIVETLSKLNKEQCSYGVICHMESFVVSYQNGHVSGSKRTETTALLLFVAIQMMIIIMPH